MQSKVDAQFDAELVEGLVDGAPHTVGGTAREGVPVAKKPAELAGGLAVKLEEVGKLSDGAIVGFEALVDVGIEANVTIVEVFDQVVDGAVGGKLCSGVEAVFEVVPVTLASTRRSVAATVYGAAGWPGTGDSPVAARRPVLADRRTAMTEGAEGLPAGTVGVAARGFAAADSPAPTGRAILAEGGAATAYV